MSKLHRIIARYSWILLLLVTSCAWAQADFQTVLKNPPKPAKLVTDYTKTLTPDQLQALERKLVAFDDSTSNQIAVVLVPSTDGMDPTDAATELGRAWGVGTKNNNGVVLLIAKGDRKMAITPGDGLEKVLPDVTTQYIITQIIRPNFRGDDYYRGIDQGTDAIMKAAVGQFKTPRKKGSKELSGWEFLLLLVVIIIILSVISRGGGGGGDFMSRRGYRGIGGGPIIFPGGGGWSGGGGGGGFGGGGFGGFGGGSFGGGGSSGSW